MELVNMPLHQKEFDTRHEAIKYALDFIDMGVYDGIEKINDEKFKIKLK